jgi:N-acetylglucosamine kinase-like BadF-type ATPase
VTPTAGPPDRLTVFLGVDAGGSHTVVVLGRGDGTVLARASGLGGAMRPGGAGRSASVIAETARRAAAQAGAIELPVARAVVGAAGAGRLPEQQELAAALVATGVTREARVVGDGEIALAAAFGDGPGILLSAGTGSIAYARDPRGRMHRSGGYGWQMGDEGGGYWLGRRALEAAGRAFDGREEGSTLLGRLLTALGLQDFDNLIRWAATATPPQVAALAPHVLNAALEGEVVAQQAVADAARELVQLVRALLHHFPDDATVTVATGGGLLRPASPLFPALRDGLRADVPRARLSGEPVDAPLGALRLAAAAR